MTNIQIAAAFLRTSLLRTSIKQNAEITGVMAITTETYSQLDTLLKQIEMGVLAESPAPVPLAQAETWGEVIDALQNEATKGGATL